MSDWIRDPEGFAATLPPGFRIGVSSAAFQIEGALREGGRGPSTWDEFMTQPRRIADGSTAEITTDHYHRVTEDVGLISRLGADVYRFSLAWPRIQPTGSGPINKQGIEFYDRLIDQLLAQGISPAVTLFHWDLPEPLQHRGGWLARDTAWRLADFALLAAQSFGDRVHQWITINEPTTVTLNGYALGIHAPGATLMFDALIAAHHQLLGHGLAVQALRSESVTGAIGMTNVHSPAVPAKDSTRNRLHARVFDLVHNRIYADAVLLGRYPKFPMLARSLFKQLIEVDDADLAVIAQPLDFYGLNYYMPTRIALGRPRDGRTPDGDAPEVTNMPFHLAPWPEYPTTGFGWPIAPEFLSETLRDYGERYEGVLPPVYITEGGASFTDFVDTAGAVNDPARIAYLADHLAAAAAGAPGVDVQGYYVWTLTDNWEWAAGFSQRFGLVRVDFDTLARSPKASYRWLQRVLASRPS
jgi:beta-glucosidase